MPFDQHPSATALPPHLDAAAALATDDGTWDASQVDGIVSAVRDRCGPATAARVHRMLCKPEGASSAAESAEIARLRDALQFYARRDHFQLHEPNAWDTVSGEPANFYEDESNTATVEDGSVAKAALEGLNLDFAAQTVPPGWGFKRQDERSIEVHCPTFTTPLVLTLNSIDRKILAFYAFASDLLGTQPSIGTVVSSGATS